MRVNRTCFFRTLHHLSVPYGGVTDAYSTLANRQ